jgi:hypothetical protein
MEIEKISLYLAGLKKKVHMSTAIPLTPIRIPAARLHIKGKQLVTEQRGTSNDSPGS